MSDAKVTFEDKDHNPAAPGAEVYIYYQCPKFAHACGPLLIAGRTTIPRDPNNQNGGKAQWNWNGNREAPTLTPSVNCSRCWHGYIENGRCVNTAKQDEPEPIRAA